MPKTLPLPQAPPPPCKPCGAACCRDHGVWPFATALTPAESKHPLFTGVKTHNPDKDDRDRFPYIIKYKQGKCPFLNDGTSRCRIYDNRPDVCKEYDCRDRFAYVGDKSPFFRKNEKLVTLLRAQGAKEPQG